VATGREQLFLHICPRQFSQDAAPFTISPSQPTPPGSMSSIASSDVVVLCLIAFSASYLLLSS
jgi:hypothetical protein